MHNGGLLMKPACRDFRYRLSELVQTAFPICWAFQTGPALQPSVSIQPFLRSSTKIQPREIVLFFCNQPPTLPPLYHLGLRDCSTLLPASTTIPLRKVHYPIKISALRQANSTQGSVLGLHRGHTFCNSVRRAYVRLTNWNGRWDIF